MLRRSKPDVGDVEPYFNTRAGRHAAERLVDEWGRAPRDRALDLDWSSIAEFDEDLAHALLQHPDATKECIRSAVARTHADDVSGVSVTNAHVRLSNLPESRTFRVGGLRERHLGTLVDVRGEVVDVDNVDPLLTVATFRCRKCGGRTRLPQGYGKIYKPDLCPDCDHGNPGWTLVREESTIIDFQSFLIIPVDTNLDDPATLPIYCRYDLVNRVGEGDTVTVTGTYEVKPIEQQGQTQLNSFLEAWDVNVEDQEAEAGADTHSKEELATFITDAVEAEQVTDGTSFGASVTSVVSRVVEKHDVRKNEVEGRLEEMDDDGDLFINGSQILTD